MIKIENLSVIYHQDVILDEISVNFNSGTVYVISGASGSGKTSFLNILGLIQKANKEASLKYNNLDLLALNEREKLQFVKNNMGYIFQQNNLINNLSVFDNVALQLTTTKTDDDVVRKIVLRNLAYVGILDLKDKFPSEISGGEKQRVAIARALSMNQQIIIADEPSSALDAKNRDIVIQLLVKIAKEQGKTVIIATHDERIIEHADVHYKIAEKTLIEIKSTQEIKSVELAKSQDDKQAFIKPLINFNRKQKKKAIPKAIPIFIGFAISVAIIGMNIIGGFVDKQKLTYDNLADKSIFIVNDSIGIKSTQDREDLMSFSNDTIEKIKNTKGITDIKPFFEFPAYGLTKENVSASEQTEFELKVGDDTYITKNMYSVQPMYEDEKKDFQFLEMRDDFSKDSIIVSQDFLDKHSIPYAILGQQIEISAYVPIKQFVSQIQKTVGSEFVEYEYDGNIYIKSSIKGKVGAILKKSYPYDRSKLGNSFFYDFDRMNEILHENIDDNITYLSFEGFPEKKLAFSAYRLTINDISETRNIIENVKNTSKTIETYSVSQNTELMKESIDYAKQVVLVVTGVILFLVIGILFFTFYLTNNARKKQVGILKALGISKALTIGIYVYELMGYAFTIAIVSTVISSLAGVVLLGNIIETSLLVYLIKSFCYSLVLSIICVCLSGIIPIVSAMKFEPVDIIRINKEENCSMQINIEKPRRNKIAMNSFMQIQY